VPVDRSYVAENDAQRERLRALVRRLSDQDLAGAMDAGWTVAGVLGLAVGLHVLQAELDGFTDVVPPPNRESSSRTRYNLLCLRNALGVVLRH
jgi:hypothetical protein